MILVLMTGNRNPYVYLFTKMKSPTSKVGTIELDGIRNGSNKNERTTNTTSSTGKNERAYSTTIGSDRCPSLAHRPDAA